MRHDIDRIREDLYDVIEKYLKKIKEDEGLTRSEAKAILRLTDYALMDVLDEVCPNED